MPIVYIMSTWHLVVQLVAKLHQNDDTFVSANRATPSTPLHTKPLTQTCCMICVIKLISNYNVSVHFRWVDLVQDKMTDSLKTPRPRRNGRHFANFFKCICLIGNHCLSIKISLNILLSVQLPISQHWISWWVGTDQATSHYLKQWWPLFTGAYMRHPAPSC